MAPPNPGLNAKYKGNYSWIGHYVAPIGFQVDFECHLGYEISDGDNQMICEQGENFNVTIWKGKSLSCETVIECNLTIDFTSLSIIEAKHKLPYAYVNRSWVLIGCNTPLYAPTSQPELANITCQPNSSWTGPALPECMINFCSNLPDSPPNSTILSLTNSSFEGVYLNGTKVLYSCAHDFIAASGFPESLCIGNETWIYTNLVCISMHIQLLFENSDSVRLIIIFLLGRLISVFHTCFSRNIPSGKTNLFYIFKPFSTFLITLLQSLPLSSCI